MKTRKLHVDQPGRIPAQLRLKGQWLVRAGFTAGQEVTVTVEDGRLTIEVKHEPEPTSAAAVAS